MSNKKAKPDPNRKAKLEAFDRLLTIMDELRENCPWDMKQTMESLRHLTVEETYELSDAIIEQDMDEIKKELGDLMVHLVFYARIASEKDLFDISDVINAVSDKLIQRHPHIYGDLEANDAETVKENWEKIKLKEGDGKRSVLEGVPKSLPAIIKAIRIQEKARGVGFDWESKEQVWQKVQEEIQEFRKEKSVTRLKSELGDLLFSVINYARFIDLDPEEALEQTNKKFIKRFRYMETKARADGKRMGEMTLNEMDKYWEEAKSVNEDH